MCYNCLTGNVAALYTVLSIRWCYVTTICHTICCLKNSTLEARYEA